MSEYKISAPIAEKIEKELTIHNDVRIDNYYWLNQKENPKVIDYLNAENNYYDAKTAHTKTFQEDLFEEMKSRIKEDDESVPYKKNDYYYTTRFETGKQYPIYARKKESLEAVEEIMFEVNKLAEGHNFYKLSGLSISPNNKYAAYGVDTVGRREYTLQFKDLETGELFPEKIKNTTGGAAWATDNKTVFYTQKNPITLRSEKIFRHILGTDPSSDVEVFYENEEAFSTYVYRTKSDKYLIIGSHSSVSTEYRILEADNPTGNFRIFQTRERDLEYNIAHYDHNFYVLTNKDNATNFKLMKTSSKKTSKENWQDVLPHRADVLLEDISIFKDFLVVEERSNGLNKIRIIRWDNSEDFYLPFEEETYSAGVYYNPEFDTNVIRYGYNSMTTPSSVIDFNVDSKTKDIKKEQQVLGGKFDKNNYKSERLWATAKDGTKIAISLVYKKSTKISKNTPLLLYGYGSYGHTIDAGFSSTRLSLLDRGFVFAIAHVRGSEYLGRNWYENGKLLNKLNTFYDFIDCAKFLIQEKYTSPKHLYASGGSAGGLLMGAVINLNPELFNGVVASVPFVDVLTTMLDDSIPLTTGEYDEWGNPNEKESYDYMKLYSPYDNVKRQNYPNMLVTTGLHDSQVQYFEPAKWVAKLRDFKTDNNLLVLYTDMEAGHGGASGRFDALKEIARDYSFIIDLEVTQ
ncbi:MULTISPECIES: S9 family peptidase [Flavobacteriaceae]|uniref:Proline-specific endopeptidase n=2 Tax=Flavobacteriaceae TaxID=49546 RepID=A0A4Y8AX02_9FLAO|nr:MULTISPECIES: S9 family peptidase [Flavobacteriaceae]TEW76999.1 S9 family peptidase [Gramella jeungdoensis]GGK58715.1 oligopeptidase B [Lutibacter litoralis]